MTTFNLSGQLIDLFHNRIYPALIEIHNGIIQSIKEIDQAPPVYLLPGFVDAHIHIESSMMVPSTFARLAVVHGTVATISDPHEIANINGLKGIQYMIENSKLSPFKFFFGAPSCVPATSFETAGAILDAKLVAEVLDEVDIWYLSEMMNYPGVLNKDKEVLAKIEAARKVNKPVDGHAPGLKGKMALDYALAGITTDHECFTLEEALDKIKADMHILIREGSAAKNYEALADILHLHPQKVMFCSDDKHPDSLILHHINDLVKRSLKKGYPLFDVLRAACMNPVLHYKVPVGLLREKDPADFIVVKDLHDFEVLQTFINGQLVAEKGKPLLPLVPVKIINHFRAKAKVVADFAVKTTHLHPLIRVIEAIEGQLVTNELQLIGQTKEGEIVSDLNQDILKLVVINRYQEHTSPQIAFIKNFGLKTGAIASTVAHDCHNIIAVGVDDASICLAVNTLIESQGGIAAVSSPDEVNYMPLPVAGLMSAESDGYEVARQYSLVDQKAKELGTPLQAPFMTLSFMALLVIPSLKLSDQGLFDGKQFKFTSLEVGKDVKDQKD